MNEIKAGVVVVTKFCRSSSREFASYIDYIGRDEAVRTEYSSKYNLYHDYMGNPEKSTGLFTEQEDIKTDQQKKQLKDIFQTAQDRGSLMWQTVVSFDNRWLENNGLYDSSSQILDERRVRNITRSAVRKMLEKEGLQDAAWSAAIHYNTDNIHVHIAIVEPEPMREKKSYVQYETREEDGKTVKTPKLDGDGHPVMKKEYKGTFRQGSIETCRREMVNQIINEKENNLKINTIIRESIVKQKREHPLAKDKELAHRFLELYQQMPDCSRNMWNYNNPVMHPLKQEIDSISEAYMERYHGEEYRELKERLQIQGQKYHTAYGDTGRSYADTKMKDLYTRMGNAILKEVRQYDKEERERRAGIPDPGMAGPEWEGTEGVTNDPLQEKRKTERRGRKTERQDAGFTSYRTGKIYMDREGGQYDVNRAVEHMEKAWENGNAMAACQLGKLYMEEEYGIQDTRKGIHYLEQAAEQGNEQAAYRLGSIYRNEKYGLKDDGKAYHWFLQAEKQGSTHASYQLGKMDYENRQYKEAAARFDRCGDSYAAYYLGRIHLEKDSGMFDPRKGIQYLEQSAQEGNSFAELGLGWTYLKGEAVPEDREKAENWFQQAAEHGNEQAVNILKEMHTKHHIRKGVSLQGAVSRMKKGMKSEWERARLEREHARMVEQSLRE